MSFFVTMVDDSYQFTTAGYVAMFLILIAVFMGAAVLAQKENRKSMSASIWPSAPYRWHWPW